MDLPPGPVYFFTNIPRLALPPLVAYILDAFVGLKLPRWAYLMSLPLAFMVEVYYIRLKNYLDARRLGARQPQRIPDWTPGNLKTVSRLGASSKIGYPTEFLEQNRKIYGDTYIIRHFFEDRIMTVEPEHIKAMLATQFEEFEKGHVFQLTVNSLLGTGVFNSDGDMWRFHRSITRPFFSKDRISHFDIFDRHADAALQIMKKRFKEGYPVDFQDVVGRFTVDSASEFLFGHDIRSLDGSLPYPSYAATRNAPDESNAFFKAFRQAQIDTASRTRLSLAWPLFEFWKDKTKEQLKLVRLTLDPLLKQAIENKKRRSPDEKIEADQAETLLEYLVEQTEDEAILRDEILNLAVAGQETTMATLTFAIYMLAEHPDVFHRLRQEVLTNIGSTRRPTFEDFRNMKYMRAVINETLRLYPAVPFNQRAAKKATTLPGKLGQEPFFVAAGQRVTYSVFSMHRRTDLWGPDALEFDPDRFLDHRLQKYLTPNPFIFLPFNGGPRICLGQQFAYHEASFFLVRLLQQFSKFRLEPEAAPLESRVPAWWKEQGGQKAREKVKIGNHLTMYVKDGLWVTMEEASASDNV